MKVSQQFKKNLNHTLKKISKTVANIECCQNQNTQTLQQNVANLKNESLSENEIITTPIK